MAQERKQSSKSKAQKRKRITQSPNVIQIKALTVIVRMSEDEVQSLQQIHSALNTTIRGWTMSQIVRACCKLAAIHLSLPVPGTSIWPTRRKAVTDAVIRDHCIKAGHKFPET